MREAREFTFKTTNTARLILGANPNRRAIIFARANGSVTSYSTNPDVTGFTGLIVVNNDAQDRPILDYRVVGNLVCQQWFCVSDNADRDVQCVEVLAGPDGE